MLKVSVVDKATTIEMKGPVIDVLNESLAAVGHLFCELEKIGGVELSSMFAVGIPQAIKIYREMRKESDKVQEKEEAPNENDTL